MKSRYIQQRFHPALVIGSSAYVLRGFKKVPVHCQQGDFDSACSIYCAAMSMAFLGRIYDPSVLSERTRGVGSRLWRVAQANFFDGLSVDQLAASIEDTDPTIGVKTCGHGDELKILSFIKKEMEKTRLVIVSWHALRGDSHHWILLVGLEGIFDNDRFKPTTFLALDPGAGAPSLTGYNGRLEMSASMGRNAIAGKMTYETIWHNRIAVQLTSALSLG